MTQESEIIEKWKQKVKYSIDTTTNVCKKKLAKKDESLDFFERNVKNVPKCLYSVSRTVCMCKSKCTKEIKQLIKPYLKNCSLYDQKNVFSNIFVDCKVLRMGLKARDMGNEFKYGRYNLYNKKLLFTEGYKDVIQDFCDKKISKSDFRCYIFSFREYCTYRAECFKFSEYLLSVNCPPNRLTKAIELIDKIFNISNNKKHQINNRSIKYHDKDFKKDINQQIQSLRKILSINDTIYDNKKIKINSMIDILMSENLSRETETIETKKLVLNDSLKSFPFKNYNQNNLSIIEDSSVLHEIETTAFNNLRLTDYENNSLINNALKHPVNKSMIYIPTNNIEKKSIFYPNYVLSYEICGAVLFTSVIFSIILFRQFNIKNSILGIIMFILLILNIITLGTIFF